MTIFDTAIKLLGAIRSFGYEAYIVGGAPRDILMNIAPEDVDIATNCPVGILDENFKTYDIGKSRDFGIVALEYEGNMYEIAQFRTESDYNGKYPGKVEIVSSLKEDVNRRDFTVNALAMNEHDSFIDLVGGKRDLDNKLIRAVGDPGERFNEDYVRMIRAARFGSMDGFKIESETARAIRSMAPLVQRVTPERIRLELKKAAKKPGIQFAKFIVLLDELKLLEQILPEIYIMKQLKHDMKHHPEGPTVFDHVIKCIEITDDMYYLSKLGVLLHDVGKGVTADDTKYPDRTVYHGHASAGVKVASEILKRLKFGAFEIDQIVFSVENHMKFHDIMEMKPSKIASLVNHPAFNILKDVAWADEYSRGETFAHHGDFELKIKKIEEIRHRWENRIINNTISLVDGNQIMTILNIKPGPEVGKIKREIEEHIIDNALEPTDELIKELILKHRE